MNILHMSDLHLGRRFYNLSFLPIQQALLQEVLQIIDDQQVTVLLLCGDIYDKPVPPADAVQLLDWFLTQLAARSVHVCMISGNHDSPERLNSAATCCKRIKSTLPEHFPEKWKRFPFQMITAR